MLQVIPVTVNDKGLCREASDDGDGILSVAPVDVPLCLPEILEIRGGWACEPVEGCLDG